MNLEINGLSMHNGMFGDSGSPLLWLSGWPLTQPSYLSRPLHK